MKALDFLPFWNEVVGWQLDDNVPPLTGGAATSLV